jgi:thioredoxin reductase (NADPH)
LSSLAKKIYLISSNESIDTSKIQGFKNVEILNNATCKTISGDGKQVTHVLVSIKNGQELSLSVSYVFIMLGNVPSNQFLSGTEIIDNAGNLKVDQFKATKIPGIFAAGDIVHGNIRQIITANSDGVIAAISAIKYIKQE